MFEIGGRPILWHIMKIYSAHGINEFIICCGYKSEVIKDFSHGHCAHGGRRLRPADADDDEAAGQPFRAVGT
jgi:NDP-sugar pyrophosphorylase family protein